MGERRDVAVYSPGSWVYFEQWDKDKPHGGGIGGGAELQMAVLAEALARANLETALILWPAQHPLLEPENTLELVERPPHVSHRRVGALAEAIHIWRAMARADAHTYIFRGGSPRLLVALAFCKLRGRRLVFSAANDLDFEFEREDRSRLGLRVYRAALRRADLIVAQSEQQLELARAAGFDSLELIPSFSEPASPSNERPDAFLWIGRMVDYKRPHAFVRLAEALPEIRFRMICFPTVDTPPGLPGELEEAADRLPNLELLGLLPRSEVLRLIERAFAVLSTSEAEGMPNIFLEAWARGIPVVSLDYDPDGQIEKLGMGLVAGGSEQRMREQVETLWRDETARGALGESGREYVVATHSPAAVRARWAQAVQSLNGG